MLGQIFDPLLRQARSGAYHPWLAESIEANDDYTVWTVTLRSGVTFHNGDPVSAQTVADMWEAHQRGEETSLNPLGMVEALIGAMNHAATLSGDAPRVVEYTTQARMGNLKHATEQSRPYAKLALPCRAVPKRHSCDQSSIR